MSQCRITYYVTKNKLQRILKPDKKIYDNIITGDLNIDMSDISNGLSPYLSDLFNTFTLHN